MKILALGTACVDVYPQKDIVTPGGEALNIAAQLSFSEDVDVYLMGMIGHDKYALAILDSISQLDIDTCHLYQVEGETANHVIHINKEGDRYFESGSWNGGVSVNFLLDSRDRELLSQVDAVMTTLWEPNLRELLEIKNEKNYLLAVDFNDQRDFTQWEDSIGSIDIFFSSAEESMKGIFHERSKTSETLFVLTFGEFGSIAYYHGQAFECPAVKVDHVVDTTGCGDCYQGHFVTEYLRTNNIQLSMEKAAIEAARVTAYVGGFSGK